MNNSLKSFAVGSMLESLSPRDKLVSLARVLHREGYDDHTTGHITLKLPDGTFLVNPFELTWNELQSGDVMRMNHDGKILEGKHSITPAITLHVELHKAQTNINVAVHGHPNWATVWACKQEVPQIFDQTSALAGRHVAIFSEYGGSVDAVQNARAAVAALGTSKIALLVNHGVFCIADSIEEAYIRCSTIEWRARKAWQVQMLGGGTELDDNVVDELDRYVQSHMQNLPMFEAAIRHELRHDPHMFDV